MKTISSLRVPIERDSDLKQLVADHLGIGVATISEIRILKKSLDARAKRKFWNYSVEVFENGEKPTPSRQQFKKVDWKHAPPIIIGAGPAGLFAAWTFLQHGIKPILLERGERMHARMKKISRYWRTGELDLNSNVCNGEGGAGTFSDGKLITRIKSKLIETVMKTFVDYGAPEEITYVYNPHVGSNLIRNVIQKMTNDLIAKGADLRFMTSAKELNLHSNQVTGVKISDGSLLSGSGVILACGHSAGEFFKVLDAQGVHIEPKSFALGLRIEHPQDFINKWQLGNTQVPDEIRAAQYKLSTYWDQEKIGVYTFCMCPGGYVVSSTTDPETIVVNGMSNYHRNSHWANAAVVVSVDQERVPGNDKFKMMTFQREIEHNVFKLSQNAGGEGRLIPVQRVEDFLKGRLGTPCVKSSSPSGTVTTDLSKIFPAWIYEHLCEGLRDFEKKRPGFLHPDAVLHAVESRTSSPIRITRDPETLESVSTQGLYPCGEGPGYAGGITSAAVDGMRAAMAFIEKLETK